MIAAKIYTREYFEDVIHEYGYNYKNIITTLSDPKIQISVKNGKVESVTRNTDIPETYVFSRCRKIEVRPVNIEVPASWVQSCYELLLINEKLDQMQLSSEITESYVRDAEEIYQAAEKLFNEGNYEQAVKLFDQCSCSGKHVIRATRKLITCYIKLNNKEMATEYLYRIVLSFDYLDLKRLIQEDPVIAELCQTNKRISEFIEGWI